jgi:hypothetical protein
MDSMAVLDQTSWPDPEHNSPVPSYSPINTAQMDLPDPGLELAADAFAQSIMDSYAVVDQTSWPGPDLFSYSGHDCPVPYNPITTAQMDLPDSGLELAAEEFAQSRMDFYAVVDQTSWPDPDSS